MESSKLDLNSAVTCCSVVQGSPVVSTRWTSKCAGWPVSASCMPCPVTVHFWRSGCGSKVIFTERSFSYDDVHKTISILMSLWGSSLITGLDCRLDHWTGLLDWIAGLDSEQRCQTSMQDCMYSEGLCLARSYGLAETIDNETKNEVQGSPLIWTRPQTTPQSWRSQQHESELYYIMYPWMSHAVSKAAWESDHRY